MPAFILNINLFNDSRSSKPIGKFLEWFLSYGRYIIIGTQIIVLLAFFSRFKLDEQLSNLNEKIQEKVNILEVLKPVEINFRILQHKVNILSSLESNRQFFIEVINDLQKNIPEDVGLELLSIDNTKLTVKGEAATQNSFRNFLTYLKKSNYFTQISLDQLAVNKTNNSIDFTLSSELKTNQNLTITNPSNETQ